MDAPGREPGLTDSPECLDRRRFRIKAAKDRGWKAEELRKLGMIGGMSWVSTAIYYDMINKGVARRLGGTNSAPLLLESYNFEPIMALQKAENWDRLAEIVGGSARKLQAAGAEGLILCSNTMHKIYDRVKGTVAIPIIHIGDVTVDKLVADGVKRTGLIGTRYTMAENFYRERLEARGIQVAGPDPETAAEIDRIISEELAKGMISRQSQRRLKTCLTEMGQARQQAVILGCTELVMLVDPDANVIPIYDTTAIHSKAAVDWILA